jgi:hypothetical protein
MYFFHAYFLIKKKKGFPQFNGIQLVVTVLSHLCNSSTDLGEVKVESPLKHNPTKPHCILKQCLLNPEASHTNVWEETPYPWQLCQLACARPATGVARE